MRGIRFQGLLLIGLWSLALSACNLPPNVPVPTSLPVITTLMAPPPTPISRFINMPPGAIITKEAVGAIPAGARVAVSSGSFDPSVGWVYDIWPVDGAFQSWPEDRLRARAREDQLEVVPDYNPSMQPPPARYWGNGLECVRLVTMVELLTLPPDGGVPVPAGTQVRVNSQVGSAIYLGGGQWTWVYIVTPDDLTYALEAREDQLTMAPGAALPQPGPSPTAPYEFGSETTFITLEQIGSIPAGTRVSLGSAYYDCGEWVFSISTEDGLLFEEARENQIAPAP